MVNHRHNNNNKYNTSTRSYKSSSRLTLQFTLDQDINCSVPLIARRKDGNHRERPSISCCSGGKQLKPLTQASLPPVSVSRQNCLLDASTSSCDISMATHRSESCQQVSSWTKYTKQQPQQIASSDNKSYKSSMSSKKILHEYDAKRAAGARARSLSRRERGLIRLNCGMNYGKLSKKLIICMALVGVFVVLASARTVNAIELTALANRQQESKLKLDDLADALASQSNKDQYQQDRNTPNNNQAQQPIGGNDVQHLGDLVAIGGITLLDTTATSPSRRHRTMHQQAGDGAEQPQTSSGRLIDRIAISSNRAAASPLRNPTRANKLDYIIDFMRANRLTKFCDLLTSQAPEVRDLVEQLNAMDQFTLFVPTNEALLLMAPDSGVQLEQVRANARELKQFLMAHATAELVVPRIDPNMARHQLLEHRWAGSAAAAPGAQVPMITSSVLAHSLAGTPLRITTAPLIGNSTGSQVISSGAGPKLELIVNGANVLSGHSHALQEPQNASATYAIVHLVDKSLYPAPRRNMLDQMRIVAPRMAAYIDSMSSLEAGGDLLNSFKAALIDPRQQLTAFVPNDDAFRATPVKLLEQLDRNKTFLGQFIRSHLVDGIYFSGQLSGGGDVAAASQSMSSARHRQQQQAQVINRHLATSPSKVLHSLANLALEFESKTLQSRQLVLVNGAPVLEPDVMATNGVIHLIGRPIFERHLLEACACELPVGSNLTGSNTTLLPAAYVDDPTQFGATRGSLDGNNNNNNRRLNMSYELEVGGGLGATRPSMGARPALVNWFGPATTPLPAEASNELEREESSQSARRAELNGSLDTLVAVPLIVEGTVPTGSGPQKLRAQRSGSLVVMRNNRDFYRPSAAPLNLQPEQEPSATFVEARPGAEITGSAVTPTGSGLSSSQSSGSALQGNASSPSASLISNWLAAESGGGSGAVSPVFEVERYKVVLNATSRQRLREQQMRANQTLAPLGSQPIVPTTSTNTSSRLIGPAQFVYDQPLRGSIRLNQSSSLAPPLAGDRLEYAPASSTTTGSGVPTATGSASGTTTINNAIGTAASGQRQQRLLLKFRPDDALVMRQPTLSRLASAAPGAGATAAGSRWSTAAAAAAASSTHLQQASSLVSKSTAPNASSDQLLGKTAAPSQQPGSQFGGCAFYDTECKRIVGRLTRLPSLSGSKHFRSGNTTSPPPAQTITATTLLMNSQPSLDSTFGETTTDTNLFGSGAASHRLQLATGHAHVGDIARIRSVSSHKAPQAQVESGSNYQLVSNSVAQFPSMIPSQQQQQQQLPHQTTTTTTNAQILLVPVRMFHETGVALPNPNRDNLIIRQNLTTPSVVGVRQPIYFGSTTTSTTSNLKQQQQHQHVTSRPSLMMSINPNQQYHTPTLRPSLFVATSPSPSANSRLVVQLHRHQTNFTSIEPSSFDGFDGTNNNNNYNPIDQPTGSRIRQQSSGLSSSASSSLAVQQAVRKSPVRVVTDSNRLVSPSVVLAQSDPNMASIKEARKLFRLEQQRLVSPTTTIKQQQQQIVSGDDFGSTGPQGDISITFAKLTSDNNRPLAAGSRRANLTSGGLATLASNHQDHMSNNANFVRSLPIISTNQDIDHNQASAAAPAAADYYQNRTIAEIMDDSGLLIDGQQVTFNRLKDCLVQADLLSLVTQPDSSMTIFMPTDAAFQRLVQQQAIAHQSERNSRTSLWSSGRRPLTSGDSNASKRHLLPLIAKSPAAAVAPQASNQGQPAADTTFSSRLSTSADINFNNDATLTTSAVANRLTLDCSSPQVRQLLLDHLAARSLAPRQMLADTSLAGLGGRQLLLSSVASKKIVVVDGQPVIAATRAKNGMVYVINKFLNLTNQMPSVVDLVESQPNLTTFQSYLAFSSLADRLKRETGPITILAPTNEAFEQLSTSARQLINSDPSALSDILRGHVVEGAQFGKLISMRNKLKTINSDQTIEAKVVRPNVYQLDNQLTSIRLIGTAGNGVVNSIDRLIVPPWLRVSMGNNNNNSIIRPTAAQPTARSPAELDSSSVGLPGDSIISQPLRNSMSSSQRQQLNLPVISSRPVTFEQPADRLLAPLNQANSFTLAASNNNIFDNGFEITPPPVYVVATNQLAATDIGNNQRQPEDDRSSQSVAVAPQVDGRLPASFGAKPTSANNGSDVVSSRNMQLIEKLAGLMKTNKFVKYLLKARLGDTLKPDMNYVILIPTDQAVDKLPRQIIDMLDRDQERLADLINYHVLDTTFEYINTIPDGQTLNTLNEKDILFNWHRNNTVLTASGAVVLGGIQEDNIALLIVDRVLYPTPGDLLSLVSKSPILSNFTALIKNAQLDNQLTLSGPFTLFAPSDIAFSQLSKRDLEYLQNSDTARRFLLRHLSQPAIFTSSIALSNATDNRNPVITTTTTTLQASTSDILHKQSSLLNSSSNNNNNNSIVPTLTITNLLGEDLNLRQRNDYFSVNDVNFSYADVAATNGVMHVIDGLI